MKHEPSSVDRYALLEAVRGAYGFPAEVLTFVPVGFAAVCYTLQHGTGGQRYFLKLWPDTPHTGPDALQRLPLARALYERGLYPRVPYPLRTQDGALWARCSGGAFALFPFLCGEPPRQWPIALRDEFARTLATIHRATPALSDVLPARETFDIGFETDLHRGLEAVAEIRAADRPGLLALRDLLPRRQQVEAQLTRLHRLQRRVRLLPCPLVLCHTDAGGENLLVDSDGHISVLDWDEASVAPPEHDLHEARFLPDLDRFLRVYREAGGAAPLHLDHFAFYLLRRHLGDMTVRLMRLLDENTTAEQDAEMLRGIKDWGFAQWNALDATLESIAAALRSLAT